MAAHPVTHPSADALRAFALGKLNDNAAAALMNHLDGCPDCCKQVAAASGDDFLARLRQGRGHSSTSTPAQALSETAGGPKPSADRPAIINIPPELAANQQYEILRELGRGGMGVVYLAKNKLMDRLEVLKVVNKALLDQPGAVERFLREIRSAAKLSHANVVGAFSAVQQGELLAFAMEYIEGQDLASVVKSKGPLPVPHACFYVQQAAHGLQHAYDKGMVHRDIKPQNLILAREGKKHTVKVLDFGLAKIMREKTDDTGLTGEGKMLGTPDYIAPEQTLDAAKADIRADIYSLGCTLYHLLSGHAPFSASSLGAILVAHQMHEAKPLNLVRPEVPEELAAVVRKMMAKAPAKRYQTPLEVVQALAPFVKPGTTPKAAPELSAGAVEAKPIVKKAAPVAPPPAPAAVWPSLTEGGSASVGPRKSAAVRKPQAAIARKRKSRQKWLMGGGLAVGVLLLALLGMWAGGVFTVKTPDGTIVVANVPADAEVQVEGQTVTLSRNDDVVTVTAAPKGPHKLKVVQGGRELWSSDVTVKLGGDPIRLKCEPVVADPRPPIPHPDVPIPSPPPDPKKAEAPRVAGSAENDKGFVPLFNGKDLTDWEKLGNSNYQWRVADGTLIGRWTGENTYGGATLGTKRSDYLNFRFRVETMPGKDWAYSLVFLWLRKGDRNRWCKANIGTVTGRDEEQTGVLQVRSAIISPKPPIRLQANEWLTQEVVVEGKRIRVFVNNVLASEYLLAEQPTPGRLGITVGGGVKIRKIEVQELPSTPTAKEQNRVARKLFKVNRTVNGKWILGDDYVEQTSFAEGAWLEFGDPDWTDYDFAVDVMRGEGIDQQVCQGFRCKRGQGFFLYGLGLVNNTLFTIEKQRPGSIQLFGRRNGRVNQGKWYKMLVRVRGRHMQCFLNGAKQFDFESEEHPSGCVSLRTWRTHYRFRNIKVTAPDGTILLEGLPDLNHELPDETKAEPAAMNEGFVPLFNGKDLAGWKVFGGGTGNWKVADGAIIGSGPASHLFSERGDYENFHYRVEAMINDGGNSGQYFRTEFGPRFPKGYEVQINSTHRDPKKTGSLYGISDVTEQLHKPGEWFTQEVIAQGDHLVIMVNGKTVVSTHDSRYKKGHFALQQHDPSTVVKFRKIEVKELPAEPAPRRAAIVLPPEAKEATQSYEKACAGTRAKLLADFDTALDRLARIKGATDQRLKLIEAIKAEKKRFEDKGLIPWSEPMRPFLAKYVLSMSVAEEKLRRAYDSLLNAQLRAKNESMIADLQADLESLIRVRIVAQWRQFVDGKPQGIRTLYSNWKINNSSGKATWSYVNGVLIYRLPDPQAVRGIGIDTLQVSADGSVYAGTYNNGRPGRKLKITGVYLKDN